MSEQQNHSKYLVTALWEISEGVCRAALSDVLQLPIIRRYAKNSPLAEVSE